MVKITIVTDGKTKTYAANPVTFGLQKALTRYGRDAVEAARAAQELQASGTDLESEEGLAKFNETMEAMERLTDTQSALVLRAFNNQFGPDELDCVEAGEINRVIEALQQEAYSIARKNG